MQAPSVPIGDCALFGNYPFATLRVLCQIIGTSKAPTLRQFQAQFPTKESCLEHIMRQRFGDRHECASCGKNAHYYRVSTRRAYVLCEYCRHQVYPTAGPPLTGPATAFATGSR